MTEATRVLEGRFERASRKFWECHSLRTASVQPATRPKGRASLVAVHDPVTGDRRIKFWGQMGAPDDAAGGFAAEVNGEVLAFARRDGSDLHQATASGAQMRAILGWSPDETPPLTSSAGTGPAGKYSLSVEFPEGDPARPWLDRRATTVDCPEWMAIESLTITGEQASGGDALRLKSKLRRDARHNLDFQLLRINDAWLAGMPSGDGFGEWWYSLTPGDADALRAGDEDGDLDAPETVRPPRTRLLLRSFAVWMRDEHQAMARIGPHYGEWRLDVMAWERAAPGLGIAYGQAGVLIRKIAEFGKSRGHLQRALNARYAARKPAYHDYELDRWAFEVGTPMRSWQKRILEIAERETTEVRPKLTRLHEIYETALEKYCTVKQRLEDREADFADDIGAWNAAIHSPKGD